MSMSFYSLYVEGLGYATTATKLAEAEKKQKERKEQLIYTSYLYGKILLLL